MSKTEPGAKKQALLYGVHNASAVDWPKVFGDLRVIDSPGTAR